MSSPWLERRVIAFAHQGGSHEGPSSTLAAIGAALAEGASAIELDVHATADRQIVVCHDETVDRTTNHHGAIAELTLAQLRDMDNAYWWIDGETVTPEREPSEYLQRGKAPANRDFGIVTLEEVVERFPGVLLNLDLKRTDPDVEPYEELLANELRRLDRLSSVIVSSFHDVAVQRFRSLAPEVATSAATGEAATFYFSMLEGVASVPPVCALQVPAVYGDVKVVDERFVETAHKAGIAVHVWTINDAAAMNELLDLGVDGLISDRPTRLVQVLRERDCAWDGVL
jgi:glycerophosphoryl diester phosphodiesterase